jgi:hypothetical protein
MAKVDHAVSTPPLPPIRDVYTIGSTLRFQPAAPCSRSLPSSDRYSMDRDLYIASSMQYSLPQLPSLGS